MPAENKLAALVEQGCPVFYFYSTEKYLVRQAVGAACALLARDSGEEVTVLDGPAPDVEQLIAAAGTISFFGTRRVVCLPELDAAELRDIFGDGALDFGSEKSPPKPKRKGPRKRPPARRQAVNLDALMDGIDGEERTSTPQRSQFESRVSTPSYASPFDRLQRNVVGYLDRALEFCLSDVTAEITQMIQENDPFESCIPSFLEDLRAVLREMVALGTDSPFDKSTDVQVVFDDFGASFLNIFKQAEVIRNSNHSEKARAARLAISAVANRKSQLASDMSRLVRDVKTELVELSDMRQQATQKEGELERRLHCISSCSFQKSPDRAGNHGKLRALSQCCVLKERGLVEGIAKPKSPKQRYRLVRNS